MSAKGQQPEIVQLSTAELEQLLTEIRGLLPPATYQLVESLLRTLVWIMGLIEHKQATIARLRRIIFGEKTEKGRKIFPKEGTPTQDSSSDSKPKRPGHGRKGAKDYPGARRIQVPHPRLHLGDLCPKCLKGKLYLFTTPARIVRIVAQPIFQATVYELERLRCALCGALFTASPPPEAGQNKHDPSVGTMLAITRYGMGLPMYRTDQGQNLFGVPLAASTQWKLIEAASPTPELVYEALIQVAANGSLIHSDDTTMRVQSLRQEISQKEDPRTGIFTTGIISLVGEHQIALFFTGQKHAGENLDQLLKNRVPGLPIPLHMCDALSPNRSKEYETILCNCLTHARRNFVDVVDSFPEECRKLVESLAEVYRVDALAKEQRLSDLQRLLLHQQQSQPIMNDLRRWMQEQFEHKTVEPNSGLGQAISYMLKHWEPLTRFLSVPGAPLDNNIVERALKTAIRHRKNSLSYKTLHGARIGDAFMSSIHTCQLNGINPFDYLMTLQHHAQRVVKAVTQWLPWNYLKTKETLDTG
jgi:transposase